MEILRLENLSKYYTSSSSVVMALTGIHASFSIGEFVAITGESGSGKSTLAQILGGMLPYEAGEMYLDGKPTSHFNASDWECYRRDVIGFISQSYGIIPGNTVLENVEAVLRFSGVAPDEVHPRAMEVLREVELDTLAHRRAAKLSSGQKQRLSIARALAKPSKILLADEPTGNLDRENSDKIIRLLKRASRDHLVILITHEYDEVKNDATRHIVLSDGCIVTDAPVHTAEPTEQGNATTTALSEENTTRVHRPWRLSLYTARITAKSRPVFFSIIGLLLLFTSLINFIFLGTFFSSMDDSETKIYDTELFRNGDPHRIVVMREDRKEMTEEDYQALLSMRRAVSLERFGYISDTNYYYRKDVEFRLYSERVSEQNYHPLYNPNACHWIVAPEFIATAEENFVRSMPTLPEGTALTAGRMPESFYEIVSADPSLKVGDTVTVFFRNIADWGYASYIELPLTVVGESSFGEGLYFSDILCSTFCNPMKDIFGRQFVFLPYDKDVITVRDNHKVIENYELADDAFLYTAKLVPNGITQGGSAIFSQEDSSDVLYLSCATFYDTGYEGCIVVSENTFASLMSTEMQNQVSFYIKDYAYTDRTLETLHEMGYVAFSPFKIGATVTDPALAEERIITLCICIATLVLCVLLQAILLKILFSSLNESLRLMSHIGLRASTAYRAIGILMLALTAIGIVIACAVITLLNALGIDRIVALCKYVEPIHILLMIAVQLLSAAISAVIVLRSTRKAVFYVQKQAEDLDFSSMEEHTHA